MHDEGVDEGASKPRHSEEDDARSDSEEGADGHAAAKGAGGAEEARLQEPGRSETRQRPTAASSCEH